MSTTETTTYVHCELDSSSLLCATWFKRSRNLNVTFKDGKKYKYYDVPREVFDELCSADSAGRFLNYSIRGKYEYDQVGRK